MPAGASAAVDLHTRLAAIAGDFLHRPAAAIDPATPLARLGLDSLASLELVAAIEDSTGRSVPAWLCGGQSTLGALEEALLNDASGPADWDADESSVIAADGRLPDEIEPLADVPADPPRVILLTGATGFLGGFLLRELLDATPADVWCLARANGNDAPARIARTLDRQGITEPSHVRRVRVVAGDITDPRLGLSPDRWDELAGKVDAIYHPAAEVNWAQPYALLRHANVLATRELLRIACAGRAKVFHFVSSLSVCYAVSDPAKTFRACEDSDMLPLAASLPLGYARTKCVAESLVRQAASRGMRARIYRPGLISGDSATGATNLADIMAALVKGCVQSGAAPDLDWRFDAPPVDDVAKAIVRLADPADTGLQTFHVVHPRPRSWREFVLWMHVRGYHCPFVPYDEWRARLESDTRSPAHALRLLRGFFLDRQPGGTTAAECFQEGRHVVVDSRATLARAAARGLEPAALDATLINRFVDDYVRRGFLPPAPAGRHPRTPAVGPAWWERRDVLQPLLRGSLADPHLRVTGVVPGKEWSDHSIIGELTAWRSGGRAGLRRIHVAIEGTGGPRTLEVVVKAKAQDEDAIEVAEALARACGRALGDAVTAHRERIGLRGAHRRELAVYELAAGGIARHRPHGFGAWRDDERGEWGVLLESLDRLECLDSVDHPSVWTPDRIDAALEGLSAIHSAYLGRTEDVAGADWMGHVATGESVTTMRPLWVALAEHAAPLFGMWVGSALVRRHLALAASPRAWAAALDGGPVTLIHHDFNLRNIALRREAGGLRLCAYDWELATIGLPQRDLAEFLCFVLQADADRALVEALVDGYRARLSAAAQRRIEPAVWRAGWRAAMAELLVNRLSFYAMIHRVRPQSFLPRVVRTWERLDGCVGEA